MAVINDEVKLKEKKVLKSSTGGHKKKLIMIKHCQQNLFLLKVN